MAPASQQVGVSNAWSCETLAKGLEQVTDGLDYDAAEEARLLEQLKDPEQKFIYTQSRVQPFV